MCEFKGSYQLGTLVGELLEKWVNRFRLKPYIGLMPENPLREPEEHNNQEIKDEVTGKSPTILKPINRKVSDDSTTLGREDRNLKKIKNIIIINVIITILVQWKIERNKKSYSRY